MPWAGYISYLKRRVLHDWQRLPPERRGPLPTAAPIPVCVRWLNSKQSRLENL